jgi:TPR repeat protein
MMKLDLLKKTVTYPPAELLEIEQCSNHNLTAPIALFLIAEHRQSGLTIATSRFFISTFAKNHLIACRIFKDKSDLQAIVHSLPTERIQFLIIHGHGSNFRVKLGRQSFYGIDDVKKEDFYGLLPSVQVLLLSCRTGNGLAQKIADESGMTVFAPQKKLELLFTFHIFCPLHKSWELRSYSIKKGKQHIVKFNRNSIPVNCEMKTTDERDYFIEQRECLTRWAHGGDSSAQLSLGNFYLKIGNLKEAKIWYRKAANQQVTIAQHNLARVYETEGNLKEAVILYRQAVQRGYRPSKIYLERIDQIAKRNLWIKATVVAIGLAAVSYACWIGLQYYRG